jgi:hypothetical protein
LPLIRENGYVKSPVVVEEEIEVVHVHDRFFSC